MQREESILMRRWAAAELLPVVSYWVVEEGMPVEARALQARANAARRIGEISTPTHAFLIMATDSVLRFLFAEGVGQVSAWIEPGGAVIQVPYGGHKQWIEQNVERLKAEGISADDAFKIGDAMMQRGWIRYSGGAVMTYPFPNDAQIAAMEEMVKDLGVPADYELELFIREVGSGGAKISRVLEVGLKQAMQEALAGTTPKEPPLGRHLPKKADAGGGTSGPFQQGDGQETDPSFMERVQDGSSAPFDQSCRYLSQDLQPEVWWARDLLQYLKKNYPGKQDVSGPASDGASAEGTGPGQQFASQARRLQRIADMTDPSDTDPQHDQVNEDSMETHLLDPDHILYKGPKGRGAPTQELKTRLGGSLMETWRRRRADKAVEQDIIQKEKDLKEPGQIKKELQSEGVPPSVIEETYEHRDRNLVKTVEIPL